MNLLQVIANVEPNRNVTLQVPPTFRPDVIVAWPRNCDYPLWRFFIRMNRSRFNEVIIIFTETYQGEDYRNFVRLAMHNDYIHFVDSPLPGPGEDWRHVAVSQGLIHSYNSQWIWFTEEDFYIYEDKFWNDIYSKAEQNFELMAIAQSGRIHPACMFMTRDLLNKTRKQFGIVPNKSDHFSLIQEDLEKIKPRQVLYSDEDSYGYKHYNGLSHNWTLVNNGELPNYKPDDFYTWLKLCLELPADFPMDVRFINVANKAISAKNG